MYILFLDHDGVICLSKNWGSRFLNDTKFDEFDSQCIEVLNEILDVTDLEIVVSSDWQLYASLEELQELYKSRGIRKVPLAVTDIMATTFPSNVARALNINNYIARHPEIEKYVVLDDLNLSGKVKNFIQCSPFVGLKAPKVKKLIFKHIYNKK